MVDWLTAGPMKRCGPLVPGQVQIGLVLPREREVGPLLRGSCLVSTVREDRPMPNSASPARVQAESAQDRMRAWYAPGWVALLVGVLLVMTPLYLMSSSTQGLWGDLSGGLRAGGWMAVMLLARLSVVAGVLVSGRRTRWATALVAWPFLLSPVIGFVEGGWWLGLLTVAVLAGLEGWRRVPLPLVLALAVAAGYCWTGAPASLPTGLITANSPGSGNIWISLAALCFVASTAPVAVSASIGAVRRSRHRTALQLPLKHPAEPGTSPRSRVSGHGLPVTCTTSLPTTCP
jgi:hypothetical protein